MRPGTIDDYNRAVDRLPRLRAFRPLVVSYAETEGGLTLAYLRLRHPHFWGSTEAKDESAIAEELGRPIEELRAIYIRMIEQLTPTLKRLPEFQQR